MSLNSTERYLNRNWQRRTEHCSVGSIATQRVAHNSCTAKRTEVVAAAVDYYCSTAAAADDGDMIRFHCHWKWCPMMRATKRWSCCWTYSLADAVVVHNRTFGSSVTSCVVRRGNKANGHREEKTHSVRTVALSKHTLREREQSKHSMQTEQANHMVMRRENETKQTTPTSHWKTSALEKQSQCTAQFIYMYICFGLECVGESERTGHETMRDIQYFSANSMQTLNAVVAAEAESV